MITEKETLQAGKALVNWFKSQDIMPGDASIIMLRVMATQLVNKSRDPIELRKAVNMSMLVLDLNVIGMLGEGN